jgi:hypothetical protein
MTRAVETRLDDETLVDRIPMRSRRRSGGKRIGAPDGSAILSSCNPQPDGALVKALDRTCAGRGSSMKASAKRPANSPANDLNQSYVSNAAADAAGTRLRQARFLMDGKEANLILRFAKPFPLN